MIAAGIALGAALLSLRQESLLTNIVHKKIGTVVQMRAQVVSDPHRMKARVYGSTKAAPTFSFLARALEIDGRFRTRIPIRVITSHGGFLPGQIISGQMRISDTKEEKVAALAIARTLTIETQPSRWARALASIRHGLSRATGDGDAGALIPGMVLGDTSKQSDQFQADMRRSGLTHLVAVSGANFAIVSTFVLWVMSFLFSRIRTRLIATSCALVAFIALVRPSPSVLRAAAMAAVLIYGQARSKRKDALPALGFAIAAVVIADPWQAKDPGFALSVLATAGLLLLAPRIRGPVAEPIAAMVFCAPIIIAISGFLSPMSILANVAAAPAVAPITVVGFVAALISPLAPWASHLLISLIKPLALWITFVAHWSARFSAITIAVGTFVALAIALFFMERRSALLLIVIALSITYINRFPAGEWNILQCDVGQGDALIIRTEHRHTILIDTGPDPILMDRCLSQADISSIDIIIITHSHADHAGGLSGAIKNRRVGKILTVARAGQKYFLDGAEISILWPKESNETFKALPGDGSALNNLSIAALITTRDFILFAAGDLEPPAQSEISPPHVDIYKVSHHGSRYQNEAFTRALSPSIALISVGADNSYGHPADETIGLLHRIGSEIVRTDRDGAIAINVANHKATIRSSNSGFRLWRWA